MAQRLDDPRALLVALESRHAALLHVDHLDERLRAERGAARARRAARRARAGGARPPLAHLRPARGRADRRGARRPRRARERSPPQLRQPLYQHFAVGWEVVWAQMAGRVGRRRAARARGLRARPRAPRRATPTTIYAAQTLILRRREDALAGLRRARSTGYVERNPRAASPGARSCRWRTCSAATRRRAWPSSARSRSDEFAAIPRDMFWFTAIALLGETCALIGDREQAPVLYRLLAAAQRASSCRSPRRRTSAPRTASSRC